MLTSRSYSSRLPNFVLLLVALLRVSRAAALSASPSRSTKRGRVFEFAPNGVCIQPQYFVEQNGQNNGKNRRFAMRNVPGEGDCMFLAVALAAATSLGLGGNDALLRAISRETREVVAQILESPSGNLHISGNRLVKASDLLKSACRQTPGLENPADYLAALRTEGRQGGLYGGGPELTVLANVLRRPISIYELEKRATSADDDFENGVNGDDLTTCNIVCKGRFGEGLFEDPCATIPNSAVLSGIQPGAYSWQLHILVLDVSPNEKHACVLLPETPVAATVAP